MYEYTTTQVETHKRPQWRSYISLLRFRYHGSFIGVVFGAAVITRQWQWPLAWRLLLLYFSLNVLLYGGLYTLNAITDAESDRRHPGKKNRPVASGEISRTTAGVIAAGLIITGFLTGWAWFGLETLPVYVLFLALNVSYSLCFRNVFVLDLIFNSATHPLRFWIGVWLAGGHARWGWLVLVFLIAIGISASRRSVELLHSSAKSRRSLASYSRASLLAIKIAAFGMIMLLWIISRPTFKTPYIVMVCAYFVCVGGIEFVPRIRSLFERLWLR